MRGALIIAASVLLAGEALAAPAGTLTYLDGGGTVTTDGGKVDKLRKGAAVSMGDVLKTYERTRAELTFKDGSKLRIGPKSHVRITTALFSKEGKRKAVDVRLFVGKIWANVVKATSGAASFEVHTDNAVGGVRGTSFAVLAAADASAIVRVYAGAVGVRPALGETTNRKRIPGPSQIDRRQWEEIVATAMKQVRISSAGEISAAEDFEGADDWASWNQKLDGR